MLTDNFKRYVVDCLRLTGKDFPMPKLVSINNTLITAYAAYGTTTPPIPFTVSSAHKDTIGQNGYCYIALGTNAKETVSSDVALTSELADYSNFTITAFTNVNATGLSNKKILSQTYTYSGNSPITINEIGLYSNVNTNGGKGMTMFGRISSGDVDEQGNPLFSPITVSSNGDMFTVQFIID